MHHQVAIKWAISTKILFMSSTGEIEKSEPHWWFTHVGTDGRCRI